MSTGLVIPLVWAVGGILMFRPIFRGLASSVEPYDSGTWNWEDATFVLAFTVVICSVFWPLAAGFFLLRRLMAPRDPTLFVRRVGGESPAGKRERREKELAEREEHVARLERELGIGQDADVVPLRREQQ